MAKQTSSRLGGIMINNEKTAVQPKNEKQALEFIQKQYARGYKWDDRLEADENTTNYCFHGTETCYYVFNGIIQYSDVETCFKHKYHIIPYR